MGVRIILLETSTSLCSVALLEDDKITAVRTSDTPRSHASLTAPFVQEVLDERGLRVRDCSAVCLSMGPGSYTGLRVGSSSAKGLCFGAGIPLLAVSTLDVLVAQAIEEGLPQGCRHIVPMIDARRMEVYTAVYSADGTRLSEISPRVVEGIDSIFGDLTLTGRSIPGEQCCSGATLALTNRSSGEQCCFGATLALTNRSSEAALLSGAPAEESDNQEAILFIGDGVAKCESILSGPGRFFRQECPRADAMKAPALREFAAGAFRDTAYFEPFYLKDFVATVGKRLF